MLRKPLRNDFYTACTKQNFINPKHYVKNRDARKKFTISKRNHFQPIYNEIESHSNNSELNMTPGTNNNQRNDRTMKTEKPDEK